MHVERLEGEKRQLESRLRLLENGVRQRIMRDAELRRLRFQLQQSLERLRTCKSQQKAPRSASGREVLNKEEPNLDLEKMVAEYRKGRK